MENPFDKKVKNLPTASESGTAYGINTRHRPPHVSVSPVQNDERYMSVDAYFDELIDLVRQDYARVHR